MVSEPNLGPYRIILADPPWAYNNRRATRLDNPGKVPKFGIGAAGKYGRGCMSHQDLVDMGELVHGVSTDDAYLFLWATCPRLPDAIALYEAWGFVFATVAFVWEKLYPNGTTFRGPGAYTPSNVELILVGRKSRLWHGKTGSKPAQVIRVPHPRNEAGKIIHSRKPGVFQDQIEAWLGPWIGDGKYLELFATKQRPGWACLGDELTKEDIRYELRLMVSTKNKRLLDSLDKANRRYADVLGALEKS